jgi:hypothetical protein
MRKIRATAFSILFFTESTQSSGVFLKKKPPSMQFQWQQVNRKCSVGVEDALHARQLQARRATEGADMDCIQQIGARKAGIRMR